MKTQGALKVKARKKNYLLLASQENSDLIYFGICKRSTSMEQKVPMLKGSSEETMSTNRLK